MGICVLKILIGILLLLLFMYVFVLVPREN